MAAEITTTSIGNETLAALVADVDVPINKENVIRHETLSTVDNVSDAAVLQPQQGNDTVDDNNNDPDQEKDDDNQLLMEGTRLGNNDEILAGARLLRKIKDPTLLLADQHEILRRADMMEGLRRDLLSSTHEGWTKQGESHGTRDFIVYYQIENGGKLKCRIESVIEASLYVPFLATLNETDLYQTWFPKWSFPFKLGLSRSKKLKQSGRVEQVVQLTVDLPFPLSKREIVFWGFAEEDTRATRTVGAKIMTVPDDFDNGLIPPVEKGVVRMEFAGDFLFRPCESDHPALKNSKAKYPDGEKLILLTVVLYSDPKIAFVPHSFLNFCTRTAIGSVWRMVLHIAEEIREGKRPAHADLIQSKREELYDWVEERASLISGIPPSKATTSEATSEKE